MVDFKCDIGFSIIEGLVALTILSVISVLFEETLYRQRIFSQSLHSKAEASDKSFLAYRRLDNKIINLSSQPIFIDFHAAAPLEGDSQHLRFFSLENGILIYNQISLDNSSSLVDSVNVFDSSEITSEQLFSNIESVSFAYLKSDLSVGSHAWVDKWPLSSSAPLLISLTLKYVGPASSEQRYYFKPGSEVNSECKYDISDNKCANF